MTSWVFLHTERSCHATDPANSDKLDRPGLCMRPAHLGGLCAMHFMAAPPATRTVVLLIERLQA